LLLVIAGVSVKIGGHSDFQKGRTWIWKHNISITYMWSYVDESILLPFGVSHRKLGACNAL
jgi:hypothetical protein